MNIEGSSAVAGLLAGYLCIKLARTIALVVFLCILALFTLKHYGWMADDYSSWRHDYDEISERLQRTSYWNQAIDYLEASSKWLQRGILAGLWIGLLF